MNTQKPPMPMTALAELCRKYCVCELSLFGSATRDELQADSDLDFLVEFEASARVGFLTLAGLSRELSALLNRPVDLVPKAGLKAAIRAQILSEAEVIYAA